jgi:broad specificity phosphatase PhoE
VRLLLVRHGETDHNRGGLTLGRHDVPLNERGRAQAEALARSFTDPPDAIYSSPLVRARETAGAIQRYTGVAFHVDGSLVEMDVGEMEHLTRDQLRARYPDFVRAWFSDAAPDARMPGGETLREVQSRAWGSVQHALETHAGGTVVAVTHNFVILTIVSRALELPLSGFRRVRAGLASRTLLDVTPGGSTLLQLGDVAHLVASGLADDPFRKEERR